MIDRRSLVPPREASIDTAALAMMVRSGTPVTILDARFGDADDGRRIPGARNLSARCSAAEAAEVIHSKDTLIVTYCTNLKCAASSNLYARLRELGYDNVVEYFDGIDGWQAAEYPVEQVAVVAHSVD